MHIKDIFQNFIKIKKDKYTSNDGTIYDVIKKRILINAFFKSLFNYCPLIQMWRYRSLNIIVNQLYERYLRIQILKDFSKEMVLSLFTIKISNFQQLKCLKFSKVKVLKMYKNAMPYQLRKQTDFQIPSICAQCFQCHRMYEIPRTKNFTS